MPVLPYVSSLDSRSAPFSSSSFTTASCLFRAAPESGVPPSSLLAPCRRPSRRCRQLKNPIELVLGHPGGYAESPDKTNHSNICPSQRQGTPTSNSLTYICRDVSLSRHVIKISHDFSPSRHLGLGLGVRSRSIFPSTIIAYYCFTASWYAISHGLPVLRATLHCSQLVCVCFGRRSGLALPDTAVPNIY